MESYEPAGRTSEHMTEVPPPPRDRFDLHPLQTGVLVMAATFLSYEILGGLLLDAVSGGAVDAMDVNRLRAVTAVSQAVFLLLPAGMLVWARRLRVRSFLRMHRVTFGSVLLVIAAVAGMQFAMQGYMALQESVLARLLPEAAWNALHTLESQIEESTVRVASINSLPELATVWVVIALTPAVCEELVFRGVVFRCFERGTTIPRAIVWNAIPFALFHFHPTAFVPLAALGALFTFFAWKGDSIFLAMIGHLTNNSIAVISVYLPGHDHAVRGASSGADSAGPLLVAGIFGVLLCAVSCRLFWNSMQRNRSFSSMPGE